MSCSVPASTPSPIRIDLHCHSMASTEADEALLLAIKCPESYSQPAEVYDRAKRRGMDFVTITDHDSIAGVWSLADRADVLIGEELTCYFPEDHCKMHLLIWGMTPDQHDDLQAIAQDIYKVARYIARHRIAHSVAHPLYRQNDRLEKWHLERLILLFKGFECLNGAHSALHREAFEPVLDGLTPQEIQRLSALHDLKPLWPDAHVKARTAGSDDHGLFNIGRTWTEFPATARSAGEILECIRTGNCRPGGEAGSSLKLAHNFFSVGVRYYSRQFLTAASKPSMGAVLLQKMVGEKLRYRKRDLVKLAIGRAAGKFLGKFKRAKPQETGVELLIELFMKSLTARLPEQQELRAAMHDGQAPLAEHEAVFELLSQVNRDIAQGVAGAVGGAIGRGELAGIFDALSTVAAHQFILAPYYFALFHQNRERHLFSRLTGRPRRVTAENLRVAAFTDTLDDVNGVSRFTRDIASQAYRNGYQFTVHTSSAKPTFLPPWRKNFSPLVSQTFPMYAQLELNLPPLLEILKWCDEKQFDAVYIDTPGPMGLCGLVVAAMLRVPVLGTYHTDFPAYVNDFTKDHRLTVAAGQYMNWFYSFANRIFSRTRQYHAKLTALGLSAEKLTLAPPAVDMTVFNPSHRDPNLWQRMGVRETRQLIFCGRVSVEKNLPFLVESFKRLCLLRKDTALVIAGDGPYRETMQRELRGLPVYFLGFQNDAQLARLYASADLFVFPSLTDTMGQVIIEAQASGLPVLVSDQGGPREVMSDQITGQVLPATDPTTWAVAINDLLNDEPRRMRMAHSGPPRMSRFSLETMFEGFWKEHLAAVGGQAVDSPDAAMQAGQIASKPPLETDQPSDFIASA